MRRADRLLRIVQILRRGDLPKTALALAEELEVVPRTIYRDIAVLQASRVPIDGAAGVGYILRPGYDLPPMMFTADEAAAMVLGLNMVIERGDEGLASGAIDALAKIQAVVPADVSDQLWKAMVLVPHRLEEGVGFGKYGAMIRQAIRDSRKLRISYADGRGQRSERTVWPLGLYYYSYVTLICTWCEARADFRAFRAERISDCKVIDQRFDGKNGSLMQDFLANFLKKDQSPN
jgi:predicted DNA-binding transcriptional regulator YafY